MAERPPVIFRIVTRILLLNVLIVFLPVASMLLLDTYEVQLLEMLERSLVQQGRVLAAALGVSPELNAERAEELLVALRGRHEARLRVLDADGKLLADTSRLEPPVAVPVPAESVGPNALGDPDAPDDPRTSLLYRLASVPVRLLRDVAGRPESPLPSADFYNQASYPSGAEVRAALDGRYGATTRVSAGGQISVTLYSALPVERDGEVVGAVLASQSTFRILQDLYQVRIDVFTIFLWCLAASVVVSIFLAVTIARPIALLQKRAREAVDEHGRLRGPLPPERRRDEIGGLSRSLSTLTEQIHRYTRRLEAFAADASHELKNPLASIAASCEMALATKDPAKREQFLTRARLDVGRAESIIAAIRELSQIDSGTDPAGRCRLSEAVRRAVDDLVHRDARHNITLHIDDAVVRRDVPLPDGRVYQIVANLVGNAQSFAPPGSSIAVRLERAPHGLATAHTAVGNRSHAVALSVEDEGPVIDEPARVFDRFYSSRTERNGHLGLGLSIVKSIAESIGGRVEAGNRADRDGARVTVLLPVP
ncbi:MAG: ATP-binding protein [Spirochaetota bacterium]